MNTQPQKKRTSFCRPTATVIDARAREVTSIDPTSRLAAQLRAAAQEWRRQHPASSVAGARSERGRPQQGDPMQIALQHVARINPEDPQARGKAFRAYLAAVLTQELGGAVAQDPAFAGLVDRVRDTMQSDPELKDAIDRAGELLLKSAHPRP